MDKYVKIEIPSQFLEYFGTEIYIMRWKENSLLLMTRNECDDLFSRFNEVEEVNQAVTRFVRAGTVPIRMRGNAIEVPEGIFDWLALQNRTYEKIRPGLLIK
jgi:hypothetical protein